MGEKVMDKDPSGPVIAVVGATGQVGRVMLTLLEERRVRHSRIRLLRPSVRRVPVCVSMARTSW